MLAEIPSFSLGGHMLVPTCLYPKLLCCIGSQCLIPFCFGPLFDPSHFLWQWRKGEGEVLLAQPELRQLPHSQALQCCLQLQAWLMEELLQGVRSGLGRYRFIMYMQLLHRPAGVQKRLLSACVPVHFDIPVYSIDNPCILFLWPCLHSFLKHLEHPGSNACFVSPLWM